MVFLSVEEVLKIHYSSPYGVCGRREMLLFLALNQGNNSCDNFG